jgi:hypothetical protein
MPILGIIASSVLKVTSSYESIATANGTGSSDTITFSSIPSTYTHLQVRWIARASTAASIIVRFNSDSGANYSQHNLYGQGGGSALSASQVSTASPLLVRGGGISTVANTMTAGVFDLLDYASTAKNKTSRSLNGQDFNGSGLIELVSTAWYNTSAVTSVSFILQSSANFTTDTTFALYGIKG